GVGGSERRAHAPALRGGAREDGRPRPSVVRARERDARARRTGRARRSAHAALATFGAAWAKARSRAACAGGRSRAPRAGRRAHAAERRRRALARGGAAGCEPAPCANPSVSSVVLTDSRIADGASAPVAFERARARFATAGDRREEGRNAAREIRDEGRAGL